MVIAGERLSADYELEGHSFATTWQDAESHLHIAETASGNTVADSDH
jgi:hypothetical protein